MGKLSKEIFTLSGGITQEKWLRDENGHPYTFVPTKAGRNRNAVPFQVITKSMRINPFLSMKSSACRQGNGCGSLRVANLLKREGHQDKAKPGTTNLWHRKPGSGSTLIRTPAQQHNCPCCGKAGMPPLRESLSFSI